LIWKKVDETRLGFSDDGDQSEGEDNQLIIGIMMVVIVREIRHRRNKVTRGWSTIRRE
jgi:hypothetical protein